MTSVAEVCPSCGADVEIVLTVRTLPSSTDGPLRMAVDAACDHECPPPHPSGERRVA